MPNEKAKHFPLTRCAPKSSLGFASFVGPKLRKMPASRAPRSLGGSATPNTTTRSAISAGPISGRQKKSPSIAPTKPVSTTPVNRSRCRRRFLKISERRLHCRRAPRAATGRLRVRVAPRRRRYRLRPLFAAAEHRLLQAVADRLRGLFSGGVAFQKSRGPRPGRCLAGGNRRRGQGESHVSRVDLGHPHRANGGRGPDRHIAGPLTRIAVRRTNRGIIATARTRCEQLRDFVVGLRDEIIRDVTNLTARPCSRAHKSSFSGKIAGWRKTAGVTISPPNRSRASPSRQQPPSRPSRPPWPLRVNAPSVRTPRRPRPTKWR